MQTMIYKVSIDTYSTRQEVVNALNGLTNISAEFKSTGFGKGEIHITVPEDFTMSDALALGAYVGQTETIHFV